MPDSLPPPQSRRRDWLSVLARAEAADLEAAFEALAEKPVYHFVRRPEMGTVMVRGRVGGTGEPFHLGEATVTRCTVQVETGEAGTAFILGRSPRRAELAAVFDALLQDPASHEQLQVVLIRPLADRQARRRTDAESKAAATRVNFFTMVRGD